MRDDYKKPGFSVSRLAGCAQATLDTLDCEAVVMVALLNGTAHPIVVTEGGVDTAENAPVARRDNAMLTALGALRFSVGTLGVGMQGRARYVELHRAIDELITAYVLANPGAMPSEVSALELCAWAFDQWQERPADT